MMKIYRLSYEYKEVYLDNPDSDEDDSDLYGKGEQVFKGSPVRLRNSSEIREVVLDDQGNVIGATSEEWDMHASDRLAIFSFDIAIHLEHRGKKIGTELITRAIKRYENEKYIYEEMGFETEMQLEAINLRLADALVARFGFKVERRLPDRVYLTKK